MLLLPLLHHIFSMLGMVAVFARLSPKYAAARQDGSHEEEHNHESGNRAEMTFHIDID